MLFILVSSYFKKPLPVGPSRNTLTLHVLPNDIDINFHMNNGRYLTICDLNRVDLFFRTGLARLMFRNNWIPIITKHTMTYKKPLKTFQSYCVSMELTHWDHRQFYMKHQFARGNRIVAEGTSNGVIRGKNGVIKPDDIISELMKQRSATLL
jgi:acyl-CoA thioesterase FadM